MIRSAGNRGVEAEAAPSPVPVEASLGSDVRIQAVSQRVCSLGPELESGESELGMELELELDELSSVEGMDATRAIDLSPTGTLTVTSGLTSQMGAVGFG